jgi:hypothetical protein
MLRERAMETTPLILVSTVDLLHDAGTDLIRQE